MHGAELIPLAPCPPTGTTVLAGVSVNKFWRGHTTQEQNVRFDEFNKQRTRERHVVPCAGAAV